MSKRAADKVFFPVPVTGKIASQKPEPTPSARVTEYRAKAEEKDAFIRERIEDAKVEGFDEGAIVARKFGTRFPSYDCINWGVVTKLSVWAPSIEEYKPLKIRWFTRIADSEHSLDDVYLIHAAVDAATLEQLFDIQDTVGDKLC